MSLKLAVGSKMRGVLSTVKTMKTECIVLIGMSGVGKSTLGELLAHELGFSFTDLDKYIVEKEQKTIQEIINDNGEDFLLKVEKQRMSEIDLTKRVIAPGGSIIYNADVMEYLKANATLVYLEDTFAHIGKHLAGTEASRGIVGLRNKSFRQI